MTAPDQLSHDDLRGHLAEYALGILDGRDRALVIEHVDGCEECAEELRALSATADALVQVPVAVDPPLGFESRVIERIRRSDPPVTALRWRGLRLVAAAAAVVVAFAVGWVVNHETASPPASAATVISRALVSSGRSVGLVYVDTGRPSWMFVSLDKPGAPAQVRCVIRTKSGQSDLVGTFALSGGHGAWGTALPVAWSDVRSVDLTSPTGATVATLGGSAWSDQTPTVTN